MAMLSNQELVCRVPLFATLTPPQVDALVVNVDKQRLKRGTKVVEQGKMSNTLYLILAGRAQVVITDGQTREVIVSRLKAGDCVGEMSLIDSEVHSATVVAETQLDVLVLGRDDFARCIKENSAIASAVMRNLVQRLRYASQRIASLALMGVYGRVANVLLDAAEPNEHGELMIREKISRQDLAKMVGASREMVSRVMKDFEEQGFVQARKDGGMRVWERRSQPR